MLQLTEQTNSASTAQMADLSAIQSTEYISNRVAIRSEMIEGEPWFVAKDVCDILDLKDTEVSLRALDDDEKLIRTIYASGQGRQMWTVNESGLYHLIFVSRKPEAKAFRRWVTGTLLPQLRRTGQYRTRRRTYRTQQELYGASFTRWQEAIQPWIGLDERRGIAQALGLTLGHVTAVMAGRKASARVAQALTTRARLNRAHGRTAVRANCNSPQLYYQELFAQVAGKELEA